MRAHLFPNSPVRWFVSILLVAVAIMAVVLPSRATSTADADVPVKAPAVAATTQFFLKVEGIEGDSTDENHKGQIEVISWGWGNDNATNSGDIIVRKPTFTDVSFSFNAGKASPRLMLACAQGRHIPQVVLTGQKGGEAPVEYVKVTLSDVVVSSYRAAGSSGGDLPLDQVTMDFGKIVYEYRVVNPDGSLGGVVRTGWDLRTNRAI